MRQLGNGLTLQHNVMSGVVKCMLRILSHKLTCRITPSLHVTRTIGYGMTLSSLTACNVYIT